MESRASRSLVSRPTGLRGGIVVGLALALVGIGVGTATGAVTPFQKVVIVNDQTQAIPVSGTVNVANLPASQPVSVTNFPATQPVSGTVAVSNLKVADKKFYDSVTLENAFEVVTIPLGQTMNVTALFIVDGTGDNFNVSLDGYPIVEDHESNFIQNFTVPVVAHEVQVTCLNLTLDCHLEIIAFGY